MRIALYDLDRTLTRRATFTPFLMFAAARIAPWRLVLAPLWIVAMIGYRAGLYDRTALKRFGMRLMVGRVELALLENTGAEFAARHIARSGWNASVIRLLEEDRQAGARIAIATAAFGFYADAFAQMLGVELAAATRWDGTDIPGGNCYGAVKRRRIDAWLAMLDTGPGERTIRVVSDSFADAPLFDLADEKLFVTGSTREAGRASAEGWGVIAPD